MLLSQPNLVKQTQQKQRVGWDRVDSLFLVALEFKQHNLHLGKDGLEGAWENSSPHRID